MSGFNDLDYLEQVYAALFAQLQTAKFAGNLSISTFARAIVAPAEFSVADQPALVMVPGPFDLTQKDVFGPTKARMTAMAFVYFRRDGAEPRVDDPVLAQTVNYLIWGVVQSLWPTNQALRQTLGDLVHHCWVEGEVNFEIVEEQCIIGVPIHILV